MLNNFNEESFNINLIIDTNWSYVSNIRDFVSNILRIRFQDNIIADKASLAVSELLENGGHYSYLYKTYYEHQSLDWKPN